MFLTVAISALSLLVGFEGWQVIKDRFKTPDPWCPSVAEIVEYEKTDWVLVETVNRPRFVIEDAYRKGGFVAVQEIIEESAGDIDFTVWSVDWQHGCYSPDGKRLRSGWSHISSKDSFTIFYYKVPAPVVVVPKKPEPTPVAVSYWSETDEKERVLSFLRSPAGFWLAMDGRVPPVRFYENGEIVLCEDGASTEPEHADLLYDRAKKRPYIVITDDARDGWKKRTFRTMADAEMGIAAYFNRQRKSLAKFKAEVDAREGWPTPKQLPAPSRGAGVYNVLHLDDGDHFFYSRRDAMKFLQQRGWSPVEIARTMGYSNYASLNSELSIIGRKLSMQGQNY